MQAITNKIIIAYEKVYSYGGCRLGIDGSSSPNSSESGTRRVEGFFPAEDGDDEFNEGVIGAGLGAAGGAALGAAIPVVGPVIGAAAGGAIGGSL